MEAVKVLAALCEGGTTDLRYRVQWFLWAWDEAIQDQFATQTFGTASAYQLGRGLAESYWSLRPNQAASPDLKAAAGPPGHPGG